MNKVTADLTSLQASTINSLISLEIERLNKRYARTTKEWDKHRIERNACHLQEIYTALKPLADELIKELHASIGA